MRIAQSGFDSANACLLMLGCLVLGLVGCGSNVELPFPAEQQRIQSYLAEEVSIRGTVADTSGNLVSGASVSYNTIQTVTDSQGAFSLVVKGRINSLLVISASGFRQERIALCTRTTPSQTALNLPPVFLIPDASDTERMLFGGDVSFGRRWMNPSVEIPRSQFPPDDPTALIRSSDPNPGARNALQWVAPHFLEADWRIVNLETPVITNPTKAHPTITPATPHPTKEYCFFSLPGAVSALKEVLNVDYVSLGNNHVYDYLEGGLQTTLDNVDRLGFFRSGAGSSETSALIPFNTTLKGKPYSFFSAVSIDGWENGFLPIYTADGDFKGGGAPLKKTQQVQDTISQQALSATVIAQLHHGFEYALEPSLIGLGYMDTAAKAGARLIVCNHSHVAQGAGLFQGPGNVAVPALFCLGNLALDQDRVDTFLGTMARIDIAGPNVKHIRLLPIYLEDYRPRLYSGTMGDRLFRRLGEFSRDGVIIYPYLGQGWVAFRSGESTSEDTSLDLPFEIPSSGEIVLDLRERIPSDASCLSIESIPDGVTIHTGRDIMLYGDFEDYDTDNEDFEAARWYVVPTSQVVCRDAARHGAAGLRVKLDAFQNQDAVSAFRERLRVMGDPINHPNKDLSLQVSVRGNNAGPITFIARYQASTKEKEFGEEAFTLPPGTYDWKTFHVTLHMPPDKHEPGAIPELDEPRAVRLYIRQGHPLNGEAVADFDDFAIINWEKPTTVNQKITLKVPNAQDFLRLRGPAGSTGTLRLILRRFKPSISLKS